MSFSGLEKYSGFKLTPRMILSGFSSLIYGDMILLLKNQTAPDETEKGATDAVVKKWTDELSAQFERKKSSSKKEMRKNLSLMAKDFHDIKREKRDLVKVGIVGEIYVKYSPLANNHLEDFLISEGCEPVLPMLLEFVLYCTVTAQVNHKLYGHSLKSAEIMHIAYNVLHKELMNMIKVMKESEFTPPHDFDLLRKAADKYINQGVCMGEGWMITAEMAVLAETGVENIICTQPFGCLPNHIVAKGMSRKIKETHPYANIVAIDYDPGATKVNQENRIKLMLANSKMPKD